MQIDIEPLICCRNRETMSMVLKILIVSIIADGQFTVHEFGQTLESLDSFKGPIILQPHVLRQMHYLVNL